MKCFDISIEGHVTHVDVHNVSCERLEQNLSSLPNLKTIRLELLDHRWYPHFLNSMAGAIRNNEHITKLILPEFIGTQVKNMVVNSWKL